MRGSSFWKYPITALIAAKLNGAPLGFVPAGAEVRFLPQQGVPGGTTCGRNGPQTLQAKEI